MVISNAPTIAVLIANYNNGRYLEGALESVLSQTYPNWVVTILDDGSTDRSFETYKRLKDDSRFRIIRNEKNCGIALTRKRLVEETDCELMCFLDPDDELTPNALEDHVMVHVNHPEVSIVFSRHFQCDSDLSVMGESRYLRIPDGESYFSLKDFHEEHLVSFKKSFYSMTSGMNPIYRLAEDTFFNVMMEEVGKPYCLDSICYKYRRNGNSLTRDYSRHMFWNLLVQYDTCIRRNVDVESQVYDWYIDAVEYAANDRIYKKELEIRNSAPYRLGSALLLPVKMFKRLFKKINRNV